MDNELKSLIEDAAKLLGIELIWDGVCPPYFQAEIGLVLFNPLDPERGDLWKVADAAELMISYKYSLAEYERGVFHFTKGDYQSQAIAVLRAASAVLKTRGGE